jgi:hypothetical protein
VVTTRAGSDVFQTRFVVDTSTEFAKRNIRIGNGSLSLPIIGAQRSLFSEELELGRPPF